MVKVGDRVKINSGFHGAYHGLTGVVVEYPTTGTITPNFARISFDLPRQVYQNEYCLHTQWTEIFLPRELRQIDFPDMSNVENRIAEILHAVIGMPNYDIFCADIKHCLDAYAHPEWEVYHKKAATWLGKLSEMSNAEIICYANLYYEGLLNPFSNFWRLY